MSKEKFLLYMLAGIFAFQAGTFGVGLYYCANNGGLESCPDLGKRYDSNIQRRMVATTLALLNRLYNGEK